MRAGRLHQRVTLYRRVDSQDEYGEVTGTWEEVDTVWAGVEPLVGREQTERGSEVATFDTRIRLRWRDDVRYDWEVGYGAQRYSISSVVRPFENRRELVLLCNEVLNNHGEIPN
jgi:SPP1 family predicted phage head-tail adaptor